MLTAAAAMQQNAALDPKGIDGKFGPASLRALRAFERLFTNESEGLVTVRGQTFEELVKAAGPLVAPDGPPLYFPT